MKKSLAVAIAILALVLSSTPVAASQQGRGPEGGTGLVEQLTLYFNLTSCKRGTGYQIYQWNSYVQRWDTTNVQVSKVGVKVAEVGSDCGYSAVMEGRGPWWYTPAWLSPNYTTSYTYYVNFNDLPYVVNAGDPTTFGVFAGGVVKSYWSYRRTSQQYCMELSLFGSWGGCSTI